MTSESFANENKATEANGRMVRLDRTLTGKQQIVAAGGYHPESQQIAPHYIVVAGTLTPIDRFLLPHEFGESVFGYMLYMLLRDDQGVILVESFNGEQGFCTYEVVQRISEARLAAIIHLCDTYTVESVPLERLFGAAMPVKPIPWIPKLLQSQGTSLPAQRIIKATR